MAGLLVGVAAELVAGLAVGILAVSWPAFLGCRLVAAFGVG